MPSLTPLNVGDAAPDFTATLVAPDGQEKIISLSDFTGKTLVLYFYPKDDTPGCTLEAKDFKDLYEEFKAAGAEIVGVSKDSAKKHVKFCDKYALPFSLITDEETKLCAAYGVWVEKSMYGKKYMGIQRATFVIQDGKIAHVWPKVKVTGHAKEVLEAVQS